MPSNDIGVQMSLWLYGIPDFNPSSLFTYFDDLNKRRRNNSDKGYARKKELYSAASSYAASVGAALSQTMEDDQRINSALEFLLAVAQSEQAKELKVLNQYRDLLKQALPNDKHIDEYINKFSADLLNQGNVQELEKIYQQIVQYITVIRTNAENYQERLENFKKHQKITMKELYDDDYRMRLAGEIHAIENSVTGKADKRQKDEETVYASLLRSTIGDYLVSSDVISRLKSGEDIVACVTAIAIDIEEFMRKQMYKRKKDTSISAFTSQELKTMFNEYLLTEEREQSRLEYAIENDEKELNDILNAAKEILGINDEGLLTERQRQNRRKKYERQLDKSDSIINKLVDNNLDSGTFDSLLSTSFSATGGTTMHGNIYELVNVVLNKHGIKVSGSAATDTLTLGSILLELNNDFDASQFMKQIRKISTAFSDYASKIRKDRFDDQQDAFENMNTAANVATKKINDILKNMKDEGLEIEDIFIYHDSLKLYKSVETSEINNQKFHGRDLAILSYIDELYSMNGMVDLGIASKDALQFLALNIPDGAAASKQKQTVASYLGMFAGMLMFDDVQNMAYEAVSKINLGTDAQARNIHLYNLNGFYVPGSMILRYTYEAMKSFSKDLMSLGAKVEISTSAASKVISDWVNGDWRHGIQVEEQDWQGDEAARLAARNYYSANEWARVGNAVASGINVRIAFFAGFATFIQSLP